jgi:hypothetical protein
MGLIIGPTPWWQSNLIAACPVGTTLLDGSRIISKAGGTAYIVAPSSTQVSSAWAGGQYNSTLVGDKCCICEWPGLNTLLIQCGFNPCDWCVPSHSDLFTIGYTCRTNWDTFSASRYWSSTEGNSTCSCTMNFSDGAGNNVLKSGGYNVRAFRRVTY